MNGANSPDWRYLASGWRTPCRLTRGTKPGTDLKRCRLTAANPVPSIVEPTLVQLLGRVRMVPWKSRAPLRMPPPQRWPCRRPSPPPEWVLIRLVAISTPLAPVGRWGSNV
ncbi:hypothetical protein LY76DRAFT_587077 [Colletotrichum caudatum]|nr:hypothetical protein LY76DRAFT_587077 [Colletotrichum caudatum]